MEPKPNEVARTPVRQRCCPRRGNAGRHDRNLLRRPPRRKRPKALRKRSNQSGNLSRSQNSKPVPRVRGASALRRSAPSPLPPRAAPCLQDMRKPLLCARRARLAKASNGICGAPRYVSRTCRRGHSTPSSDKAQLGKRRLKPSCATRSTTFASNVLPPAEKYGMQRKLHPCGRII